MKIWNLEGEDADYFKLNQNGMVTVDGCPGYKETMSAVVKVKLVDGTVLQADVRLHALRDVLIEQKFKAFKDTYITSNMTDEEKITKVAWYAGAFSDYEAGQPGWMDLLLRGKGDCMASRLLVARMCVDLGMKAYMNYKFTLSAKVQMQREMLKKQLENCKSKEKAHDLYIEAMSRISDDDPTKKETMAAYNNVYDEFRKSDAYEGLPATKEEAEEKDKEHKPCMDIDEEKYKYDKPVFNSKSVNMQLGVKVNNNYC